MELIFEDHFILLCILKHKCDLRLRCTFDVFLCLIFIGHLNIKELRMALCYKIETSTPEY